MAVRRDPVARILDGLLRALARYGVQRVSMTDIATEAGISRGTLYRYFSTKDDVLAALGSHVLDDFKEALKTAVEARPRPEDRLHTVLQLMVSFVEDRPSLDRVMSTEPAFVMAFFRTNELEIVSAIEEAVAPGFGTAPRRGRRSRDVRVISEMIFRMALSYQMARRSADSASVRQVASVLGTYVDSRAGR